MSDLTNNYSTLAHNGGMNYYTSGTSNMSLTCQHFIIMPRRLHTNFHTCQVFFYLHEVGE
jgi:hypothetical protein